MISEEKVCDPLIRLEKDGKHWLVSVVEFDPPRDMHLARAAALRRLREEKLVPGELIDLVEGYNEEAKVQLVGHKEGQGLRFLVNKLEKPKSGEGMSASEALAFFLRILLRELRLSERKGKAAVRADGLFPRGLIGEIALDLLIGCQVAQCAPGPMLGALLQELLQRDTAPASSPRSNLHEKIAFIVAQHPSIKTRELARALG